MAGGRFRHGTQEDPGARGEIDFGGQAESDGCSVAEVATWPVVANRGEITGHVRQKLIADEVVDAIEVDVVHGIGRHAERRPSALGLAVDSWRVAAEARGTELPTEKSIGEVHAPVDDGRARACPDVVDDAAIEIEQHVYRGDSGRSCPSSFEIEAVVEEGYGGRVRIGR